MKKFLLSAAVFATVVIGYTYTFLETADSLSDIQLANVEALTTNEAGGSSFEYPNGYPYSTVCNVAIGSNWLGTKRCKVEVIVCQGGGSGCNSKKCPAHPA